VNGAQLEFFTLGYERDNRFVKLPNKDFRKFQLTCVLDVLTPSFLNWIADKLTIVVKFCKFDMTFIQAVTDEMNGVDWNQLFERMYVDRCVALFYYKI
jgi:hypothetical protein